MSVQNPPTLQELAKRGLLQSLAAVAGAAQYLPFSMILDILTEAISKENTAFLKALIPIWPLPRFPLGALLWKEEKSLSFRDYQDYVQEEKRITEAVKAILAGLEVFLSQKDQPRTLQVVDMRDLGLVSRTKGPKAWFRACSMNPVNEEPYQCRSCQGAALPLRVISDMCFEKLWKPEQLLQLQVLRWAKKKHVHVCGEKVKIYSHPFHKILRCLPLDSIRDLEVGNECWTRKTMQLFVPHLKKFRNLHTLRCGGPNPFINTSPSQNRWFSHIYARHMGQLDSIRELHMKKVFFLRGALHKILRGQPPLEGLFLNCSPLKEADLKHLAQCPSTQQLKHLGLQNFSLQPFHPNTLRALLDRVSGTLETLVLDYCKLTDNHLRDILPALCSCVQLRTFSFYGNPISMDSLKVLLLLTAGLAQLSQGRYPRPRMGQDYVDPDTPFQVPAELMPILKGIRPSLSILFCPSSCAFCQKCQFHGQDPCGTWEDTAKCHHRCYKVYDSRETWGWTEGIFPDFISE